MEKADVVIVGAGLGGLSLGALLANSGENSVLVLEKSAAVGGRARVTEKDGFLLDWGVHAMLHAGASDIARIVQKTGGRLRARPVGMCLARDGRFEPLAASNILLQLFSRQPFSLRDAVKVVKSTARSSKDERQRIADMSLAEWLEDVQAGPRLERLLKVIGIGLFAVDDINNASALECFQFLGRAVARGYAMGYPVGGWQVVLDALRQPIERSGRGELRLRSSVEKIEVKNGCAVGVVLDSGDQIGANTVVWAAPAQALPGTLPAGTLKGEEAKRMAGLQGTYGVCIDFALERPVSKERRCIFTLDPPTLGWFVSNVDPTIAPKGCQLLTVFSPISPDNWRDKNYRRHRRDALRATYFELFPEISSRLMWERPLDTMVNSARSDPSQTRQRRPGIIIPDIDNLLLIGDSASGHGFGGEIPADSALQAFKLIGGSDAKKAAK